MDLNKLREYAKQIKYEDGVVDRNIIARVSGVTFEGRQELLSQIDKQTLIKVERERRNEYDFYAVKVVAKINKRWQQIGYLPKKMSRLVATSLDNGITMSARVQRVKGGVDGLNYGLDINLSTER